MPNTNHYLAIDPGKTTGWALFNKDGEVQDIGDVEGINEFLNWVEDLDPHPRLYIIESYIIRRTQVKQNAGSKQETLQVIGAIKRIAYKDGAKVVEQRPDIKPIGYKFLGIVPSKTHRLTHRTDAMAHGRYYLQKNKIVKSRLIQ